MSALITIVVGALLILFENVWSLVGVSVPIIDKFLELHVAFILVLCSSWCLITGYTLWYLKTKSTMDVCNRYVWNCLPVASGAEWNYFGTVTIRFIEVFAISWAVIIVRDQYEAL